jgi:DNA polymerase-4
VRARTILHVDLDAFYASVEQRDDPRLRGRPVIVGGPSRRGVVCAASYEARPFGVRSAMPMGEALRLCPHAVVIAPRMRHYAAESARFFDVLHRYSPLVEGLSLDEAFLDVTGEERLFGDGATIARRVKADVRAELGLVASVGVAPSKFVAKVASDLRKPDGLVVVAPDEEASFLAPLPVGRLWGVGRVTEAELQNLGLTTIGAVARAGTEVLRPRLGPALAVHLAELAAGRDDRPVVPDRAPVSIGHEDTFERDLRDRETLEAHLLEQADRVCARLRRRGLACTIVTVKVKYADFKRTSRRATLAAATADGRIVGAQAVELLRAVGDVERRGVRLTGIAASGLVERGGTRQLGFDEAERARGERLGDAIDRIAARFGAGALRRAVVLDQTLRDSGSVDDTNGDE